MLLAAKLLALEALWSRIPRGFERPFLPFVSALDHPGVAAMWPWLLGIAFGVGVILLVFNLAPRLGAGAVGSALVLDILASRVRFTNHALFFDLLLIVIALTSADDRWRLGLRGQIALLFAGAAINKLLAPDWQSGEFVRFWTHDILQLQWTVALESWWKGFSITLSWLTIALEFVLAVLVCRPRHTMIFAVVALFFHVGMLVLSGGVLSWIFFRIMLIAYLGFLDGPLGAASPASNETTFWRYLSAWPDSDQGWRGWAVWASFFAGWALR